MRALITGGAGFIGSYLAEDLLGRGDTVYIIDDLSTGSIENIEHLKTHPNFHYTIDTIMNFPLLLELTDRCDVVFHLAAAVGVRLIVESPVLTLDTNIIGIKKVLEAANKDKKKIFIASSSEIYGKNKNVPFKEEDDTILGLTTKSRWSYACSKAVNEFLALAYYRERGLPIVIARIFNTIGPRQTGRYGMVVPRFVRQALTDQPLTVYGDGTQTRSFIYVKDVTRALIDMANSQNAVGEVFNVGSPEEISINDLSRKVIRLTNSKSSIEYIPYEKVYMEGFEDMHRRVPDISKIKHFIGFTPRVRLDDILEEVIEYFKKNKRKAPFTFQNVSFPYRKKQD